MFDATTHKAETINLDVAVTIRVWEISPDSQNILKNTALDCRLFLQLLYSFQIIMCN